MKLKSIKILSTDSFTSPKNGVKYYVATAEIPSDGGRWSTVRLQCMSDRPLDCKAGDVRDITIIEYDGRSCSGRFSF